jgi:hypothetical protein
MLVLPPAPRVFVASGAAHDKGLVPDPGSSSGTTKFLREDATFSVPTAGSIVGATKGGSVSLKPHGQGVATYYMTVPDNTALDATTGISISVWVRVRTFPGASVGIFTKATAAGGSGAAACGDYTFMLGSGSGTRLFFGINGSAACTFGTSINWDFQVSAFQWAHLVATYSTTQGNAKVYSDGKLRATSGAYSANINTTGTIAVFGSWYDKSVSGRGIDANVDDLRLWKNVAISAADVTTLWNNGHGQFDLNACSSNETACWRFDEGSGTTATDVVSGLVLTSAGANAVEWNEGIITIS